MIVKVEQPVKITIEVEKHSEARAIVMACARASKEHFNCTAEQREFLGKLWKELEAQGL